MRLLGAFIGINKHSHPSVRDLSGAKRDAQALWALFKDSIEGISPNLIVDEDATLANIQKVLSSTLESATESDIVVISFSGHGTHNNRLVPCDADPTKLNETTLSMEALAELFRKSKAKTILFILDCCFSGDAPGRVLENSPTSRDPAPLQSLAGEGRILISASRADEVAYEQPNGNHGLLTYALLNVLQSGDSISLPAAMDEVTKIVRAEAGRMGITQTPVILSYIEGGLTMPGLKAGKNFHQLFPDSTGAKVSENIDDLRVFGLPDEVLEGWSQKFGGKVNALQLEAINEYRVLDDKSLLVVAPTSSGKTFIGELASIRAVMEGKKAVFLLPYKALVNEKFEQFSELYGLKLGLRVIRCSGDFADQTDNFMRGKYELALITYEMFLNLSVANPTLVNQIGLIVLDEAQFITDPNRGISVELLLTHLITLKERGISPQIICLSAVIGNVNDFDRWLDMRALVRYERPVPLIEGVLDRNGQYQFIDEAGNQKTESLLSGYEIVQRRNKPSAQDVIVPLVKSLLQKDPKEKVIVFRNMRGPAEGCAKYLADELGLPPANEVIERLPNHDMSTTSSDLRIALGGGTAFHDTNLSRQEKSLIEQSFRDPDSHLRVLAATTTLAAGINTPASTVILAEQEFIGDDGRPFTIAEFKNMVGRAGRLGFNEKGKAIVLADTSYDREALFRKYVLGQPESMISAFDRAHIETWIIRLLAQVPRVKRDEVVGLVSNTYGGYLANRDDPQWRAGIETQTTALVEKMIGLELVEVEGEFIQLTLLGHAFGRSSLSFESAERLITLLKEIPEQADSDLALMAVVQALTEMDECYTPLMKRGQRESVRPREAAMRFGSELVRLLQRFGRDTNTYHARCKRAAILFDWINGVQTEEIERTFSATPFQGKIGYGDIQKFSNATRFYLRSAFEIATLVLVDKAPNEQAVQTLLAQLEMGLPKNALALAAIALPEPLNRGEMLALSEAGINNGKTLLEADKQRLSSILGDNRASNIIEYYEKLASQTEPKS